MASALDQITQKAKELNIDDIDTITSQFEEWLLNHRNDPISRSKPMIIMIHTGDVYIKHSQTYPIFQKPKLNGW